MAGVLYAHNLTTLTALPKNFGYNMSIMILVYVVLGGIGSIRGSVIATVILYSASRDAPRTEQLPYADVRHRADLSDAV